MADMYPLYLVPAVGVAMHHLGLGESLEQTLASMEKSRELRGLSADDLATALARASTNYAAWENYQNAQPHWSIDRLFPVDLAPSDQVGMRIKVNIQYPDGHIEIASITVNARAGMSIQAVIDRAVSAVNGGIFNRPGRQNYPVKVVGTAEVFQFIEGDMANALLQL